MPSVSVNVTNVYRDSAGTASVSYSVHGDSATSVPSFASIYNSGANDTVLQIWDGLKAAAIQRIIDLGGPTLGNSDVKMPSRHIFTIGTTEALESGTAVVDFGAFPGMSDATVNVTGQLGILAGSIVLARKRLVATSDHTADEHWVEEFDVEAGSIVAGVGFTIFAKTRNHRLYGQYNVAWAWN